MSAINVFIKPDAVHLLVDGAAYRCTDGEVLALLQKVQTFAYMPAVLTVRGASCFLPMLAEAVNGFRDFDYLVNKIVDTARTLATTHRVLLEKCGSTDLDIVIAGWSARHDRPEGYTLFSHGRYGVAPWKLTALDGGLVQPADDELGRALAALGIDLESDSFDPTIDGVRLMCLQHERTWQLGDANIRAVGGWVQHVKITRDSVVSSIPLRWNDRIGAKIGSA